MLARRRAWLERIANWGTALAVPLVAIVGFKLLAHARDGAAPAAGPGGVPSRSAPAAAADRVLAPPVDAGAPPVVELRLAGAGSSRAPAAPDAAPGEDPRCAVIARAIGKSDEQARRAADAGSAGRLRAQSEAARAEAQALRCPPR